MAKSARIEIRVTESEKTWWAEAAGGKSRVSEWLRSLANRECQQRKADQAPAGMDPPYEEHVRSLGVPVAPLAQGLDAPAFEAHHPEANPSPQAPAKEKLPLKNGSTARCPREHFHRPGVYCGSCRKIQK